MSDQEQNPASTRFSMKLKLTLNDDNFKQTLSFVDNKHWKSSASDHFYYTYQVQLPWLQPVRPFTLLYPAYPLTLTIPRASTNIYISITCAPCWPVHLLHPVWTLLTQMPNPLPSTFSCIISSIIDLLSAQHNRSAKTNSWTYSNLNC